MRLLAADDPALASPSPQRDAYPEPQEAPPATNFLTTVGRLIKSGELSSFISRGVYPSPLHEALSELQRKAETANAYHLLDKAAQEPKNSEMRLMYVTAYNIACWTEQRSRMTYRPIKPLQNETFEYVDPDGTFKLLVEEVLQNKDTKEYTTCWRAWGRSWGLQYEMSPKHKFSFRAGPSMELTFNCIGEIRFAEGDCYTTTLAPGLVTSLTSSPQVFSYKGLACVRNVGAGVTSEVDLTEPGMLSSGKRRQVKGRLTKNGKEVGDIHLTGQWDQILAAKRKGQPPVTLWERESQPQMTCRYSLSRLALQFNALSKDAASILPPTDSRLRPDVQAVESGRYSKADEELQRLAMQNEARACKGNDLMCKGRWFETAGDASFLKYRYSGGYWEARTAKAKGNAAAWTACPDVFDLSSVYDDADTLMQRLLL